MANLNEAWYCEEPPYVETYIGAGAQYDKGTTFMDGFNNDAFSDKHKTNTFYPFASRMDWEMGSWLFNSGLSLTAIDKFLSLELVIS